MKTIALDISVLSDKNKTGIGVYTFQLIKNLLDINKKDKFILFGISTIDTYNYLKNIGFSSYPNVELKIYRMPSKFFRRIFLLWQNLNWPKIENFLGKVDIFHSFNWNLPPVASAKIVATVFDMTPIIFPKFHLKETIQLDQVRLNRIKKNADLVTTISENTKKDFLKFSRSSRVEVIYPGVDRGFLNQMNEAYSRKVLKKYNLDKGYILSVGTLEPRKNVRTLVSAYLKSNIKSKLVIAGKWGWEESSLAKLIKEHQDKIITTGFVPDEDLPYLYSNASIFAYPSFYEGFGIPILEAMNMGVPVISSNNSSLVEVGGNAVLYIDPNNDNSIKEALNKLSENQRLRSNLIKKGLQQAKKFSWKASAKKLNLLYQSL